MPEEILAKGITRNSGRNTDGTFGPGNPGKPKGTRHKATQAALIGLAFTP
jgi:hypothetical protein